MMIHYLPLSISNRTAATIQFKHGVSSSSLTGCTDIIEPYRTTPTKAIKTDFKLTRLETIVSIDLEEPKLINIQLVKIRKNENCPHHQNSSSASTTDDSGEHETQKKSQKLLRKPKLSAMKIKKGLLKNLNRNKLLRLKVEYFLNSRPFSVPRDQAISEEQVQGRLERSLESEPPTEEDRLEEGSENRLIRSNTLTPVTSQQIVPQFEIFQSISDDGSVSIMVLKRRNFSNWMSKLPGHMSFSEITIPGSHQSCSRHGWPLAQCQTRSLKRQLNDGIRFLDIRLALPSKIITTKSSKKNEKKKDDEENGKLVAYHGIQPQTIKFEEILQSLDDFLKSQPSETIIISIKRENHSDSELFRRTLWNELVAFYGSEENFRDHWWLKSFLPDSLDQVRGKLILFSRKLFQSENDDDFGIRFPIWPNNSAEIWETSIPNTNVAVQDWYDIGSFLSISKKSTLACVSLCGALHEPLRSSASPIPPNRSKSPHGMNDLTTVVEEQTEELQNGQVDANRINESRSSKQETTDNEKPKTWVITFLSASSLIFGFPTICSKGLGSSKLGLEIEGVNSRVARWLVSRRDHHPHPATNMETSNPSISGGSIKGVVCLMDFYQSPKEALVSLLVDCNFTS